VLLEVKDIHTYYGESYILQGVSLEVEKGEVVTLLGRNGAGKTTTLKSIIGLVRARRGSIIYMGEDITGKETHKVVQSGVGYVPEDRRIFTTLNVLENLKIAKSKAHGMWKLEKVFDLFPSLEERKHHAGNQLSGGEQQMLTIARSLMSNPELILLDEPSQGLAPLIVEDIVEAIRNMKYEAECFDDLRTRRSALYNR
jgi:branched-chain amino acid transport system ATP-binding protein